MGKNLKGKELGKGLRQRPNGKYEARAIVNKIEIYLYDEDLNALKREFELAKKNAYADLNVKKSNITLDEWFDEWFKTYKEPNIKVTSVFPMRSKYKNTYGRLLGDKRLVEITNLDIQRVINQLAKEGRAVSSMREALGRVRECLDSAKNNKIISGNPCFDIQIPWERKDVERRFLSIEEQKIFLEAVECNWYKEMFHIMFLTGMRVGEVGGLKWSDVDFENKCINIKRSLSCNYEYGKKVMRLVKPKTFNSIRKIPFMAGAEEMFLSQLEKQKELKSRLKDRYRSTGEYEDLVFVSSMGSPVLRYHAEKEIKKVVRQINDREAVDSVRENREPEYFETLYPHAIRHTFCSRCFESNMNPKVVQALMGHQSYSTTIDIYTHITKTNFDKEVEKFAAVI